MTGANRIFTPIRRFIRDVRGVSAIEFALILPVMVTLYLGGVELSNMAIVHRKAVQVASTAADLVAQDTQISNAEMADIFTALNAILAPFDPSRATIRITSLTADSSNIARVDWSDAVGTSVRGTGSTVTLPTGLITSGLSVVMAEVTYSYEADYGIFTSEPSVITETFYLKPRRVLKVDRIP